MAGSQHPEHGFGLARLTQRRGMDPEERPRPVALPVGPRLEPVQNAGALFQAFADFGIATGGERSDSGGETDQSTIEQVQGLPDFAL